MLPLAPASVKIDADLYDDLANPARQKAYPRDSRGYVRIDMSIRSYWHTLFDTVPALLELSGPDGNAIFQPFMEWAEDNEISFHWTYHLWVYEWLLQSEFKRRLGPELALKMMAAAATRWTVEREPDQCLLVLGSPLIGNRAVVGRKLQTIKIDFLQIEQVEFDQPLPRPSGNFGYFTTPTFALDYFPDWLPIPR
jgi:uncharacterized repeat protein (TIGR04061 family)